MDLHAHGSGGDPVAAHHLSQSDQAHRHDRDAGFLGDVAGLAKKVAPYTAPIVGPAKATVDVYAKAADVVTGGKSKPLTAPATQASAIPAPADPSWSPSGNPGGGVQNMLQ